MRAELLDLLWEAAEPNVFISKECFINNLDGWELEPVENDGELILILLKRGPELHFQPFGKPIPRRVVHGVIQKVIDQNGYCLTKTPKEEIRQHRFNKIIGFRQVGEDEYDIHYRIDTLMRDRNENAPCL